MFCINFSAAPHRFLTPTSHSLKVWSQRSFCSNSTLFPLSHTSWINVSEPSNRVGLSESPFVDQCMLIWTHGTVHLASGNKNVHLASFPSASSLSGDVKAPRGEITIYIKC